MMSGAVEKKRRSQPCGPAAAYRNIGSMHGMF
jgi:hypothetical protein